MQTVATFVIILDQFYRRGRSMVCMLLSPSFHFCTCFSSSSFEVIYAVSTQAAACIVMGVVDDVLLSTPFTRLQMQRTKRGTKHGYSLIHSTKKDQRTYNKSRRTAYYQVLSLSKLRLFAFVLIPCVYLNRGHRNR